MSDAVKDEKEEKMKHETQKLDSIFKPEIYSYI